MNWQQYFPHDTPRPEQIKALSVIFNAWNSGKRYVMLELGTGCGKSAVAMCVANALASVDKSTYILTSQKILQQQYEDSFDNVNSVYASDNFCCSAIKGMSCGNAIRIERCTCAKSKKRRSCINVCPYVKAREAFLKKNIGVTNYSYFLAYAMYGENLDPRELLVIDEAHRLEDEFTNWMALRISETFVTKHNLNVGFPTGANQDIAEKWLFNDLEPAIAKRLSDMTDLIDNASGSKKKLLRLGNDYNNLDRTICAIRRTRDALNKTRWIYDSGCDDTSPWMSLTPVTIDAFAESNLFMYGKKVLMLSASILDINLWCKMAGVDRNDVEYLRLDSPFPVENRRVIYAPSGRMSRNLIEKSIISVAKRIKQILEHHKEEKGIIHCSSYKVVSMLRDRIKNKRLIFQSREDNTRDLLDCHRSSAMPTVIVSPSMTEGIDLVDDASRFQIIAKLPYKSLGDPLICARKDMIPGWYACATARSILQASGRSIRSADDYAMTYILDECFTQFLKYNNRLFPDSFIEALKI